MSIQDGSCLEGYSVGYCSLCNKGTNNKLYSVQGKWFCPYCYPVAVNIKIANEKINPTTKTYPAAKVRALVEAIKKYQEIAILVFECKYEDLAAVRERFELSCINLNAALAALEFNNE